MVQSSHGCISTESAPSQEGSGCVRIEVGVGVRVRMKGAVGAAERGAVQDYTQHYKHDAW